MKLKKLIKKINKENTPPGGWRPRDKVSSSQAGGPAHKESGFKLDWYHYDNRNNPNQNYDEDPEHFEKWKKESGFKQG